MTGVAIRAAFLPARIRRRSLPDLLKALTPRGPARHRLPDPARMVRLTDRLLRRRIGPLQPNCLERSLLLYRELRRAGEPVDFCLGVRRRRPGQDDGIRAGGTSTAMPGWRSPVSPYSRLRHTLPRSTGKRIGIRCRLPPRPGGGRSGQGNTKPRPTGAATTIPRHDEPADPASAEPESPRTVRARLLAACARTRIDSAAARNIGLLADRRIDWQAFLREARSHGVLPLVARNLAAHADDDFPASVSQEMSAWSRGQAARNTLMFATLADALARLESAGLKGIPVKGPTLAIRAYDSVCLRQFSDLDILVRKADVPELVRVLEAAGYRHLKTGKAWKYVKFSPPLGGCSISISEWGMAPDWYRFPLDFEAVRARACRRDVGGRSLWQLSDEDMLLLLCGHATKHCWSKLGSSPRSSMSSWAVTGLHCPGTAFSSKPIEMAAGGKPVGLVLTRDVLGSKLPEPVEASIFADRRLEGLAAEVRRRLVAGPDRSWQPAGRFPPGSGGRSRSALWSAGATGWPTLATC